MSESSFWSYINKGMKGKWHVRRHEDSVSVGIADVSYYLEGNSWIELKNIPKLPARPTTGIDLGQWHKNGGAQRWFLTKRKGWLFIRVVKPRRYLLFDYHSLPPYEKPYWTWTDLIINSTRTWENRIDFDELEDILRGPP